LGHRAPNPMFNKLKLSKQKLEISLVKVNNLSGEVLLTKKNKDTEKKRDRKNRIDQT